MLNSSHKPPKSPRTRPALLLAGCVLALLSGCSSPGTDRGISGEILQQAQKEKFTGGRVHAGAFDLAVFARLPPQADTLHVYIEGDGRAYSSRYRLSDDPTPEDPVALEMALRDPADAVLWVARPCQYLDVEARRGCPSRYWAGDRYSSDVVAAIDAAIESVARWIGARRIGLVGYSGGGTVAALVAARRKDVAWLLTVGANLDHALWTRLHGVPPLRGSLNPVDFAAVLRSVPQQHYLGAHDQIVPPAVIESYLDRLGRPSHAALTIIADYDHHCCWPERWPRLLLQAETLKIKP